jgi:hypothetical protein
MSEPQTENKAPDLVFKHERCSWDGRCIHYAGFFDKKAPMQRRTQCDVGVNYADVERKVEYSYNFEGEDIKYHGKTAHPCFKNLQGIAPRCAKCHYPTPEEIKAHRTEIDSYIDRVGVARKAILDELQRRFDIGHPSVERIAWPSRDSMCHEKGLKDFIVGAGTMRCPICGTGTLGYSRAGYNGHIHAKCSTNGCVAWME